MNQLQCIGITKQYRDKTAVDQISLTLERGRIYGLIGRNGAGKTTLLSLLSAQTPASEGSVLLDGEAVWENRAALEHICFTREFSVSSSSGSLLANWTVKKYLNAAKLYYENWNTELEAALIEEFELEPKKKLAKLSKGMLSMVSIIVGLCSGCSFTLMDEPTAGLDVIARERFYELLLQEKEEHERTFVLSTHIIDEAADSMDEVLIINRGRLIHHQNTQELLEQACRISGAAEQIDRATAGLQCWHEQQLGDRKAVTVLLPDGGKALERYDLISQPLTLQQIFVALCGEEAK